jgi:hypothetical protein
MSTPGEEPRRLSSNAWLQRGWLFPAYAPGRLAAIGDRVSFVTKNGPVFEADRSEIAVAWPWYQLGGGVNLTVGGEIYRLSLIRPKGAARFDKTPRENLSDARREFAGELLWDGSEFVSGFAAYGRALASRKEWKAYFGAKAKTAAQRQPAADE